jgi:hypothetical protein
MIDVLRMVRRPVPDFAWRALALHVGPALLLTATVLPTLLLLGRLPRYEAPPFQRYTVDYLLPAKLLGGWLVIAWAFVLVASLRSRHPNRRAVWELWVPLLYGLGGMAVAISVPALALNLDRPYATPPDTSGAVAMPAIFASIMACAAVGLLLGRRAAATEPVPRPRTRAVWISDVSADGWWWLLQAICALLACLLLAIPYVLVRSWAGLLQTDAGLLIVLLALGVWASRGHVTISPWGIRAYYGHIPLLGWQLGIDQIASVEVGRVRLLRSAAAWQCLSHLALRDGPALIVRSRTGGRRVVTVPEAEDAAAALRRWMAERRSSQ